MSRTSRKAFNVLLSAADLEKLDDLKNLTGNSRGAELRTALLCRWKMLRRSIPTCANGSACFVPQMHARDMFRPDEETRK